MRTYFIIVLAFCSSALTQAFGQSNFVITGQRTSDGSKRESKESESKVRLVTRLRSVWRSSPAFMEFDWDEFDPTKNRMFKTVHGEGEIQPGFHGKVDVVNDTDNNHRTTTLLEVWDRGDGGEDTVTQTISERWSRTPTATSHWTLTSTTWDYEAGDGSFSQQGWLSETVEDNATLTSTDLNGVPVGSINLTAHSGNKIEDDYGDGWSKHIETTDKDNAYTIKTTEVRNGVEHETTESDAGYVIGPSGSYSTPMAYPGSSAPGVTTATAVDGTSWTLSDEYTSADFNRDTVNLLPSYPGDKDTDRGVYTQLLGTGLAWDGLTRYSNYSIDHSWPFTGGYVRTPPNVINCQDVIYRWESNNSADAKFLWYEKTIPIDPTIEPTVAVLGFLAGSGRMSEFRKLEPSAHPEIPCQTIVTPIYIESQFEETSPASGFDKFGIPPWLMIPQGGSNTARATTSASAAQEVKFSVQGGGASGSVTPSTTHQSPVVITIKGNQVGDAAHLYQGVGSQFEPAPLNLTVRKRLEKTVTIHSVTQVYKDGRHSDIAPQRFPNSGDLENYLNEVYGKQANTFFKVTSEIDYLDYDVSVQPPWTTPGNYMFDFYPGVDKTSAEEDVVLAKRSNNTFDVYYFHETSVIGDSVAQAGYAKFTRGVAYVNDAWSDVLGITAHEIGHLLLIPHNDSKKNFDKSISASYLVNDSDRVQCLMHNGALNPMPKRLTKPEWDHITDIKK